MLQHRHTPVVLGIGVFVAAAATTWSAVHGARAASLPIGLPALAGLVTIACLGLWASAWRSQAREESIARRYVELLGRCEASGAAPSNRFDSLPSIPAGSPWQAPLQRVRDLLTQLDEKHEVSETGKAALELRLQRAAAQLQLGSAVLARVGAGVIAVNAYDEVQLANAEGERLFKLGPGVNGKRRVGDWMGSDRLKQWLTDLRRKKNDTERTDDFELEDGSGRPRWYRVTAATMRDDVGEGTGGVVVVVRDVSAQKVMQRQHAEFVSAASHEMKTPLAGIKAYVELLADGEAEDEQTRDEFFGVINGQTDRLQRLIDNLLNIARIEAGVVKVSKQSRSVNETLTEAFNVVAPAAEAKRIELAADLSPLYLGALLDRDMFLQAVINLLSNAVKYTPAGGRVTLRSRLADHEIQVEVEDTGVGLSEEDAARVFEKFYRVEKDKTMAAGTGLGLPLAKHIVEDVHGGRLAVRSRLGQGSTFAIAVPTAARNS